MCFAEYGMSLAWVFYRAAVKYGQEKGKIIRGLIHSTLPCLSAVTKVVYYHYHQCMIINMYKGISPSSKAPTGHDRPKTNYVSAPSRETLGKDAHPPGTDPAQLNLPEKLNGCLCSLRPAHALPWLLSAFLSCMICSPLNPLIHSCSELQFLLPERPSCYNAHWQGSERPQMTHFALEDANRLCFHWCE